jgi:hypothetical protein
MLFSTFCPLLQLFFETDDSRKVRAAVAQNIGHAEESPMEYDKNPLLGR